MDDESDALTEKEWREMRRRMPSLQFEPVPETPALLPRSFYGNDNGADEDEREDEDYDSDASPFFHGAAEDLRADHAECSVQSPVVDASSVASLEASVVRSRDDRQKEETISRAASDSPSETPPQSVTPPRKAVFPLTAATLKSSKRRSIKSPSQIPRRSEVATSQDGDSSVSIASPPPPPVDLADLDSAIANAQEQLRVTILTAVRESTTRHEREATLERRKLEAAHANQLALLQSQLDELQTQTLAQQQQAHDATQALERATTLMVKWKQQERDRWRSPHSVQACFQAWKKTWQHRTLERWQQHVADQFQKARAQQSVLQQWKLRAHQNLYETKLQTQRDDHSRSIEKLKQDCGQKVQELQRELETAQANAAVAQDGRQQLEGDLRQVFLRGVSAMNIEALTLFKTNHQQRHARIHESGAQQQPRVDQQQRQEQGRRGDCDDEAAGSTRSLMGGESSGELPSEERMIPITLPAEVGHAPRVSLSSLFPSAAPTAHGVVVYEAMSSVPVPSNLPHGAMPSSAVANQLLKHAGSADFVLSSAESKSHPSPPPPTAAVHGLRSAELVEAHQRLLHATAAHQPSATSMNHASASSLTGRNLSPARQRLKVHNSMSFNVEMELVRSSVATAATLNARYPVVTAASSNFRRAGSLHGPSLSASVATRRASSISSPTTSLRRPSHS